MKLPEPVAWRFFYGGHGWPTFHSREYVREYMPGQTDDNGLYTADQLKQAVRDALEELDAVVDLAALRLRGRDGAYAVRNVTATISAMKDQIK